MAHPCGEDMEPASEIIARSGRVLSSRPQRMPWTSRLLLGSPQVTREAPCWVSDAGPLDRRLHKSILLPAISHAVTRRTAAMVGICAFQREPLHRPVFAVCLASIQPDSLGHAITTAAGGVDVSNNYSCHFATCPRKKAATGQGWGRNLRPDKAGG